MQIAAALALMLSCSVPGGWHAIGSGETPAAPVPGGWHELVSKEGGFRVWMMGPANKMPRLDKDKDGPIFFSAFDLAKKQSMSVGYYDMEVPADMPAAMLNREWQELLLKQFAASQEKGAKDKAKGQKPKAAELRSMTVGTLPALEGLLGDPAEPVMICYVMHGRRIFILTVEGESEKTVKRLAAPFFASFKVLPELAREAKVKVPAWERVKIAGGQVAVLMPGKPAVTDEKGPEALGEGQMKILTAYHPEQAIILVAIVIDVPEATRKKLTPDEMIAASLEKNRKGKGKSIKLGQYIGRELEEDQGTERTVMRVFVIGSRVVALVANDQNAKGSMPRDTRRFLESLELAGE